MIPRQPRDIPQERRAQVRIRVQIPARLRVPGLDEPIGVRCEDLSWGGLLLDIAQCLPPGLERLRVELDWSQDDQVSAEIRILRARPQLDGHYLLGARFVSLSHRSQARLEQCLTDLWAVAAPSDCAGPDTLVRELEVMANDRDELRQMLEQVAKGRLTMTVFDAYAPGQSISCVVTGTEQPTGVRLRASVLETHAVAIPGCDWARLYEVMLGFEHPRESVRSLVHRLLSETDAGAAQTSPLADPSPRRPRRAQIPSPPVSTPQPLPGPPAADGSRSALEVAFPEALNHLTPGWGKVQVFETLFRDLVLGDGFQLGGWPDEVWEELTLLQDVHDLAYGVSPMRTSVLQGRDSS